MSYVPCTALIVLLAISGVSCFYDDGSKVQVLTNDNFASLVLESEDIWLIEFYAPWCGHCKKLTPEFEKAAKALEGIVRLGAVDMTTDGESGQDYGIEGYPTLKFFSQDKNVPINFDGDRKKGAIIDYCLDRAKELALSRIGVESKTNSQVGIEDSDVIILTDNSFASEVYNSHLPWMIEFYAPWCKHCKKLTPEWVKLATKLKGEFKIGKIDGTVETELATQFKIDGFPSIKYFPAGSQKDDKPEEYGGNREFAEMYAFAKKKVTPVKQASTNMILEQLANQATFNQKCTSATTCILTFVPPISVSSNEERQFYLQIIKDSSVAAKQSNFNYLWVVGGDFEEFEAELNVLGSSYPVTVAINTSQKQYYNHKGGFNLDSLTQFIIKVANGREEVSDYTDLPTLRASDRRDDL